MVFDHRLRRAYLGIVFVTVLCLASPALLLGQTTTASVAGSVKDAQGAVMPGVNVTLTDNGKGTEQSVVSDALGNFLFPYVQPGTYTLKVSLDGFTTLQRTPIVVNANDRLGLGNFTLQVGSVSESITVSGRAADIQLRSGERAYTLESQAIQNIAVNGRTFFGLAGLVPGVVPNNDSPTQVSNFNANGQRSNSNNMTIDGVANIDTGDNGGNMATTNLDSVAEFKVLSSSYQAEFGRAVGAQVQVVTKSGTQNFSGSGYWYGRRGNWNANTWLNNRSGTAKAKGQRNDYGYTVGGPIYIPGLFNSEKKKLFFFFNQEWQKRKDPPGESRVTVPTALERKGDFSASVDQNGNPANYIRDYTTGLPCFAGDTRGCFADGGVLGKIPANRLNPASNAVLSLFPLPNTTGQKGYNYKSQTAANQPHREELIRVDYQATNNWRVTGRYMQRKEVFDLPYGIGGWSFGGNLDTINVTQKTPGNNLMFNTTGILNNTTSFEFSFGRANNSLDHSSSDPNWTRAHLASLAGGAMLPLLNTSSVQNDYVPSFSWGGGNIVGNAPQVRSNQAPFTNFNTTYDIVANLTKIMGSHAAKAGFYYQKSLKDQSAFANFNGQYGFDTAGQTGAAPGNFYDTGHPFANAAIGTYNSFNQASRYAKPKWRYWNYEWYLQDNWKASGQLTLDYGVRFYYLTPQWDISQGVSNWVPSNYSASQAVRLYTPTVINGVRVGIDPATGQTVAGNYIGRVVPNSGNRFNGAIGAGTTAGANKTLTDGNKFKVSPRVGFAYDITGKQNLVARGAFGIFYDRPQGNQVFDLVNNPPSMLSQSLPYGLVSDLANATAPLPTTLGLQPNVYNWKLPTVYQWNLGIQYKLPAAFTLDMAYVGSKSDNLLQFRNLNAIPYGLGYTAAAQDPTRGTCTGCLTPSTLPGGNALPTDFLRQYQGFTDIRLWEFEAYSDYKALQTTISRRFDKGLMFSFNYTRSSAKGTLGGDWDYARIDGKDKQANYGPLSFNRPNSFVMSFVYQTPEVAKGAAGFITNGWQLSGNYRWMSGTPASAGFSVPGMGNINWTGSYTEGARVALTGADPGAGYSSDPYNQFNVAAFTAPKTNSIGLESPRYVFVNPPQNQLDMSLSKSFPLGGKRRFELRFDAFNALNHTQFSGVNRGLNFKSASDLTITNLPYDASGKLVNQNGVGTISGVRAPRQLQLMTRFSF